MWYNVYTKLREIKKKAGKKMRFRLGQLVATAGVNSEMREDVKFSDFVNNSLGRYRTEDWGDMCEEDREENDNAVDNISEDGKYLDGRIFAVYKQGDWKIWIITEYDMSVTTILFPSEY
jgi:hypothetical protein